MPKKPVWTGFSFTGVFNKAQTVKVPENAPNWKEPVKINKQTSHFDYLQKA